MLEPNYQHDHEHWYRQLEARAASRGMHTWRLHAGYSADDRDGLATELFDLGVTLNATDSMYARLLDDVDPRNDCAQAWVFSRSEVPHNVAGLYPSTPSDSPSGGLIVRSVGWFNTFDPVVKWAKEQIDAE